MKAAVILIPFALWGCGASPAPPMEVRQVMKDFTMTQTSRGEKLWTLNSPEARVSLQGEAHLRDPEILFFRDNKHASTARAQRATVSGEEQDVALRGSVVITAVAEKTTLKSERLDYSTQDQRFRTDGEILIDSPEAKVKGRGLEADASLSEITIFHQRTILQ